MRFFERQREVRRNTARLGLLFGVAVAGVVWAANRLPFLGLLWLGFRPWNPPRVANLPFQTPTWMQVAFAIDPWVTASVVAAIGAGVFWTMSRVRRGGPAVAELAGGRPLAADTRDPAEVRLQHVIEEMAIASGIPAPCGYVLDGQGAINAFAAGRSTEDGAIAVTSGALEKLDREELQAVVAHEMSHVLNGDSRINLRMMCLVGGLTGVQTAGWLLCMTAWKSARSMGLIMLPFSIVGFLAGAALQVLGWFGVLGGRVLKAAVSRQREFLADASAVQFTRNPVALGAALRKIASDADAVSLPGARLDEVSHMFFAQHVRASLARMFDTHPSIEERLAALEGARTAPFRPARSPEASLTPDAVVASLGRLGPPQIEYARRVHGRIPAPILQFARIPSAARGIVGGVLLHDDATVREAQVGILASWRAPDVVEAALAAAECVRADAEALRLPLVELAMSALGRLRPPDKETFRRGLRALVEVDRRRTLFEFAVVALVEASLQPRPPSTDRVRFTTVAQVGAEAAEVLWLLARSGNRAPAQVQAAWTAGVSRLGGASGPVSAGREPLPAVEVDDRILAALAKLRTLGPAAKKDLLEALAACALADDVVTFAETEVLRAVAAAIGSPLPPLVAAPEPARQVSEART
jgi:Zn-dependent protease with chaperone function